MTAPLPLLSALLAVFALGALGTAATLWMRASGAPREVQAVVSAHEDVQVPVTVGGRSATRREVPMTRVVMRYEIDGASHTFSVDRAPRLASERFPIGAPVPAFVDARGEASLDPGGARALPVIVAVAGVLLLAAAALLFLLGRRP